MQKSKRQERTRRNQEMCMHACMNIYKPAVNRLLLQSLCTENLLRFAIFFSYTLGAKETNLFLKIRKWFFAVYKIGFFCLERMRKK